MRLLRFKLRPREVAEVARSRQKKILSKILKSAIFELQKCSKESWDQSSFRFDIKLGDFVMKKLKKINFGIFNPKKPWSRLCLGWISGKPVKIVKKWLGYLVIEMFMDRVKKFCDHSMILWEMAGDLLTSGQNWKIVKRACTFIR